jgi:hypothetical protein
MAKVTEEATYTLELSKSETVVLYHLLGLGTSGRALIALGLDDLFGELSGVFAGTPCHVTFEFCADTADD